MEHGSSHQHTDHGQTAQDYMAYQGSALRLFLLLLTLHLYISFVFSVRFCVLSFITFCSKQNYNNCNLQ